MVVILVEIIGVVVMVMDGFDGDDRGGGGVVVVVGGGGSDGGGVWL